MISFHFKIVLVERATSSELLEHEFIVNAKSFEILEGMINEAQMMKEELQERNLSVSISF
jgi:hypothetical protein